MKILIVRFSSFGDIVQALPSLNSLHRQHPEAEIHWLVREDMKGLLAEHPLINKVIALPRKSGFKGLLNCINMLKGENYTHLYDAHNNLRSLVVRWMARLTWKKPLAIVVRPKNRWRRFLYFKLRRPVFKMPFRGALSYTEPLNAWSIPTTISIPPHLFVTAEPPRLLPASFIALVPSAAWANKRWPLENWKKLIQLLPQNKFVVLGGPEDTFCEELVAVAPDRVYNLAGTASIAQSCAVIARSTLTISGDTGLLHVADQLGKANIGLIGPTAFGYTTHPQSRILETHLDCKPCSKDGRTPCTNEILQKCMVDITPEDVADSAIRILEAR